jgi:cell division protein FtsW (lipid II flippase)
MNAKPAQARRDTARNQALLIALAVAITVLGHVALDWTFAQQLQPATATRLILFGLLATALHQLTTRVLPHATAILLPAMLLLVGVGMVMIQRIDLALNTRLASAQLVWFAVASAAFIVTVFAARWLPLLARYPYLLLVFTLVLLVLPLIPGLGAGEINGARLWIDVFGMRFQPGEAAKLTLVLFLAAYLSRHQARLSAVDAPLALRQFGPVVLAAVGAVVMLVSLRDLGAAMLLLTVTLLVVFVASGKASVLAVGGGVFIVGAWLAQQQFSHVAARFAIWRDPFDDVFGAGYQLSQSLFAFATGGLTGTGLGFGRPEDLPFAATDAVFAVIGEELGLLGTTAVLSVLVLIMLRGMRISTHAGDHFTALVAFGVTVVFSVQTFVIIAGVTRLLPLTGLTLPFVSYGGSSLLINVVALALLLAIDHDTKSRAFHPKTGVRR